MEPQRGTLGKVTRRNIQVAKRITFDIEIIETLYISLRQITAIDWRGSVEWHTRTWMMWITLLKTT